MLDGKLIYRQGKPLFKTVKIEGLFDLEIVKQRMFWHDY